jgi:hypothetical protein
MSRECRMRIYGPCRAYSHASSQTIARNQPNFWSQAPPGAHICCVHRDDNPLRSHCASPAGHYRNSDPNLRLTLRHGGLSGCGAHCSRWTSLASGDMAPVFSSLLGACFGCLPCLSGEHNLDSSCAPKGAMRQWQCGAACGTFRILSCRAQMEQRKPVRLLPRIQSSSIRLRLLRLKSE